MSVKVVPSAAWAITPGCSPYKHVKLQCDCHDEDIYCLPCQKKLGGTWIEVMSTPCACADWTTCTGCAEPVPCKECEADLRLKS
jgi:hypothetical protein